MNNLKTGLVSLPCNGSIVVINAYNINAIVGVDSRQSVLWMINGDRFTVDYAAPVAAVAIDEQLAPSDNTS